ncbi:MAG TPA: cyclic nucleotide-binding domain-containing protein [Methylophilaceae bacterium]|nr:cyclic nucleotide-binding domain-containing protein [Methylophilaceae bacterium]
MQPAQTSLLTTLEPIAALSPGRVSELATMCVVETVSQGLNPFRMNVMQSEQLLYLLKGELKLSFTDGHTGTLHGGSDVTRYPVVSDQSPLQEAVALTDIQILRIDADLLDIMLTWDQLASYEKGGHKSGQLERNTGEWMESASVFSAESLKNGMFRALHPANVEEMFRRMERIPVKAGQVIIRQGDEGDYYYLIESGVADVIRSSQKNSSPVTVAQLQAASAFGEEALASGNKRNATVAMDTDGVLLRLEKSDFVELLQKPLLNEVSKAEAARKIKDGALLLDVRTRAEFNLKHIPGATNIPLHEIREVMKSLSSEREYLVYCQTGRRAAAASFILAQKGFKARSILI